MSDWKQIAYRDTVPVLGKRIEQREMLERICVRPPYFILQDLVWDGRLLGASAVAEAPLGCERGPMSAAELGRHAAIAGLSRAALAQSDGARRYYLARKAACSYHTAQPPFGSVVSFETELVALDKRYAQAHVEAYAAEMHLASFDISYAVLTEGTFERLFQARRVVGHAAWRDNPYRNLLHSALECGETWAEQRFTVTPEVCAGHFESYPALPVAVLMGQLSYLAGRLVLPEGSSYRVLEGHIEASDLCWAGETVTLRAERVTERVGGEGGAEQVFLCTAETGARQVGRMTLRLEREALSLSIN